MTHTPQDQELAAFFRCTLDELIEARTRGFYEKGLLLPHRPWGAGRSPAHPYHFVTAKSVTPQDSPPADFLPGVLERLLPNTEEGLRPSVAATLKDAFDTCLSYSSPGIREEKTDCVTVTDAGLARVDGMFWLYRFPSNTITADRMAFCCCLALSHMLPEQTPLPVLRWTAQRMASKLKDVTEDERDKKRREIQKKFEDQHTKGAAGRKPIELDDVNKKIKNPYMITLDAQGSLYISDGDTDSVWRKSPGGELAVVAGGGTSEKDGVKATDARLHAPIGIAVTGAGALIIAEATRVRRVSPGPGKLISTLARCDDNSPFRPISVKADAYGNVYVLCAVRPGKEGVGQIWHIKPDGHTVKKPLPHIGHDADLGLLADRSFRILLGENRGAIGRVWSISPQESSPELLAGGGIYSGGYKDIPALCAQLVHASAMTMDRAGHLYLSEQAGDCIRRITPGGMIHTVTAAECPCAISTWSTAVNPDGTYLYAAHRGVNDYHVARYTLT